MIGFDVLRAVLVAALAVFDSSLALAYAVAFGLSCATIAFNPAASSLLPDVVDEEDLVDANAALWTVAVVAQIVLAPTAGIVIAAVGVSATFGI